MNNYTTVYAVYQEKLDGMKFIALFMDGGDARDFADDYDLIIEEHYVPDDPNLPWLMQ